MKRTATSCSTFDRQRGSVLLVALLFSAIIGISLVSYLNVCRNSLKMSNRSFLANSANNLAEMGLEEAIWGFNQMAEGSSPANVWTSANGWTTDTSRVAAVIVSSGGSGYTSNPTITFSGGGGSGATATPIVVGGVITAVKVTNSGSNYTSSPTVTITGGGGTGASAVATNAKATRTLPTVNLDANATGSVKVFVAGHDGNCTTPLIVAQATVTLAGGEPPIVKLIAVRMKFNSLFAYGVVAKNGIDWNGHPTADSWNSNPSNSPTGPWTTYEAATHNSNTSVANLYGSVSLGAQGKVKGDMALGATASYDGTGSVTGSVSHDFSYTFTMPTYPTTTSVDNYTYLGSSVPASLPGPLDQPNTSDGRYYYFVVGGTISTNIQAGKNVTIVGSANTSCDGTIRIPSTSSLKVYTDGSITATYINQAWAGALQLYTTTTADTTLNGNDNILACIFAPNSDITGNGGGNSGAFYGSVIGNSVRSNGHMDFHYDEALGRIGGAKPWTVKNWRELQSSAERDCYSPQLSF